MHMVLKNKYKPNKPDNKLMDKIAANFVSILRAQPIYPWIGKAEL